MKDIAADGSKFTKNHKRSYVFSEHLQNAGLD